MRTEKPQLDEKKASSRTNINKSRSQPKIKTKKTRSRPKREVDIQQPTKHDTDNTDNWRLFVRNRTKTREE